MNILCINTAFSKADLALEISGNEHFLSLDANAKSSENVLPAIDKMLSCEKIEASDLDCLGVVVGVGSFTGLRIAVAIAKGFAVCNKNLKIVALNSLDLMAMEFLKTKAVKEAFYCVLNALSGRFFLAKFSPCGECLEEAKLVQELPNNAKLVGLESEKMEFCDDFVSLQPKNLLEKTKTLIENNNFTPLEKLEPLYLRLSQAEENLL